MRPSDFLPMNRLSRIIFAAALVAVICAIVAAVLGWYVTTGLLAIITAACFCVIRWFETDRIEDDANARRDIAEDAADRARSYAPEGDP